jgi:hypothetical protein
MAIDEQPWMLEPPLGRLSSGALSGRIDVSQPQLGLHALRMYGKPLDGELFAVAWQGVTDGASATANGRLADWPLELADAYVRAGDLVASFRPLPNWPFAPQIYWRAGVLDVLGTPCSTVSLLMSLQTHSLDTHPEIRVATRLAATEVVELEHANSRNAQSLLWKLADGDWNYAEIVPTSDYCEFSVAGDAAGHLTSEWRLFGEFLEKGVIRRAQLMSVFVPRERDEELATEYCRFLQRRPLPLTT